MTHQGWRSPIVLNCYNITVMNSNFLVGPFPDEKCLSVWVYGLFEMFCLLSSAPLGPGWSGGWCWNADTWQYWEMVLMSWVHAIWVWQSCIMIVSLSIASAEGGCLMLWHTQEGRFQHFRPCFHFLKIVGLTPFLKCGVNLLCNVSRLLFRLFEVHS